MDLLAIDTATERCSVAARIGGLLIERTVDTPRGHADLVLSMVDEVLKEGATTLGRLHGIVYGRGPGSFTGVRIAIGVVQGLAFGASLPTVGISNLAAIAQQVASSGERVLVCMDARMGEVYWSAFKQEGAAAAIVAIVSEQLSKPNAVVGNFGHIDVVAGSAVSVYPELSLRHADARHFAALPRARDILLLGEREFAAGRGRPAQDVQPVYLRDQVTFVKHA